MAADASTSDLPDISTVPQDLATPEMSEGAPAPGRRVRLAASEYAGTEVHHALYLPVDWEPGRTFPLIAEYPGNGPYRGESGDTCAGTVEDCNLGYGVSGGRGFIWLCLPCVSADRRRNQLQWWGDVEATVRYCRTVVPRVCDEYGGDPSKVFLAGFSRGSIACNFIGLHDDEIASLWRGFICHSHYDGVRKWPYAGSDRAAAEERLARLGDRPQFISQEVSVEATQRYLERSDAEGRFTFRAIPYRNHADTWVLRDIPEREAVRGWLAKALGEDACPDD